MVAGIRIRINKHQENTMDTAQWITLFEQAFRAMDKKLEQVLQLNSCREHWIQAEISLHAWFKNETGHRNWKTP